MSRNWTSPRSMCTCMSCAALKIVEEGKQGERSRERAGKRVGQRNERERKGIRRGRQREREGVRLK